MKVDKRYIISELGGNFPSDDKEMVDFVVAGHRVGDGIVDDVAIASDKILVILD